MARRRASAIAEDKALEASVKADAKAQERGPAKVKTPKVARDFVHAVHPETGLDVVFVPGEALPTWVTAPAPAAEAGELLDDGAGALGILEDDDDDDDDDD